MSAGPLQTADRPVVFIRTRPGAPRVVLAAGGQQVALTVTEWRAQLPRVQAHCDAAEDLTRPPEKEHEQ